jgi:hypothetical protein
VSNKLSYYYSLSAQRQNLPCTLYYLQENWSSNLLIFLTKLSKSNNHFYNKHGRKGLKVLDTHSVCVTYSLLDVALIIVLP